jgi:hypothetical protein
MVLRIRNTDVSPDSEWRGSGPMVRVGKTIGATSRMPTALTTHVRVAQNRVARIRIGPIN